jgi:hypothetical protein
MLKTTTFTISCTGDGGTTTSNPLTVTVQPSVATLSYASPSRGTTGTVIKLAGTGLTKTSSIDFYSGGQRTATLSGFQYFLSATDTGISFILPKFIVENSSPGTYQIYAVAPDGKSNGINFEIYAAPIATLPVPTATLSVSPTSVTAGKLVTLTWSSTNATSCALNADNSQVLSSLIANGTASRVVSKTTTFTVSCTGAGGGGTSNPVTVIVPVATTTTSPVVGLGDVSQNGSIGSWDAALVRDYIAGTRTLTDDQKKRADVNGDSAITDADAVLILEYVAGSITSFPASTSSSGLGSANIANVLEGIRAMLMELQSQLNSIR